VEHERRADELEKEAQRLEKEGDRVGRNIDSARGDWESKQQDQQVPGATRDPEVEYVEERAQEEEEALQADREAREDRPGSRAGGLWPILRPWHPTSDRSSSSSLAG